VKAHADQIELAGVNFYNRQNRFVRPNKATRVELHFIDGKIFNVQPAVMGRFDDYHFKLRPARNDA